MIFFLTRRMLAAVPVMFFVSMIIFGLIFIAPGDPAAIMAGEEASPEEIGRIRSELGLDKPVLVQYADWVIRLAGGDFGRSIFSNAPVLELIMQRAEPTLMLMMVTIILSIVIAVPLGVISAALHNSALDRVVQVFCSVSFSVPTFVVGYILVYLLATRLGWLPVQGYTSLSNGFFPFMRSILMPALALSTAYVALIARISRSAMLDVLSQDYIRTARAKGLSRPRILIAHALQNASPSIITVIGIGLTGLISGSVIIESVFTIPGVGKLVTDAVLRRDYPIIQGVCVIFSVIYVLVNIAVDILYKVADPRITYEN